MRFTDFVGILFDDFAPDSVWIREAAHLRLPPIDGCVGVVLTGEFRPHPEARGRERGAPGVIFTVNGQVVGRLNPREPGPWELRADLPRSVGTEGIEFGLRLTGTGWTNFLAWLGRISGLRSIQRFRLQNKNRQIRFRTLATADGETIADFAKRDGPLSRDFARRHVQLGLNIVGYFAADLGVGESARCMVRAADAAGLPTAVVPFKLFCRNPQGDATYSARLQDANPHRVNVFHIDPPVSRDIDHHHGPDFRRGKYNIAYFAWELPEFPDAWLSSFDYYDEVWCPSEFVRRSIAAKSPRPVLCMPHSIAFARPETDRAGLRERFGLPTNGFLFLTLFDLNSYNERKNPQGALAAFRASGLGGRGATLVIKVHNAAQNPADLAALQSAARDIPSVVLLTETLSRADTYALEAACDSLVSLHRSEGFGLAVAECMYLGRPVISTDWSATAEYVTADNGCPVACRPVTLERSYGPYTRGATWAEPDVEHAAAHMRALVADPALASRLGAAARATIESRFAPAVIGAAYRSRLEFIATF